MANADKVAGEIRLAAHRVQLAIRAAFISPNVSDSNLEPANVVDVVNGVALKIGDVADAVGSLALAIDRLADAVDDKKSETS